MNERVQYTPHEYKIEVMKKRISELVTNYEDILANQVVRITQLEAENTDLTNQVEALQHEVREYTEDNKGDARDEE